MKDNFSTDSDKYLLYRPHYPKALFEWVKEVVSQHNAAWDCGTGNGQIAAEIADIFKTIYATDISSKQIEHATQRDNIIYSVQPAERTSFQDSLFDCVIVGQAIHWFEFDKFYKEVRRVTKKEAVLIITGYGLVQAFPEINNVVEHFYVDIVGKYWDTERTYVDEGYRTIPFPFEEVEVPEIAHKVQWTFEHFIGYLRTWSAVKHFIHNEGYDPITLIEKDLHEAWNTHRQKSQKDIVNTMTFPILLRVGKIHFS